MNNASIEVFYKEPQLNEVEISLPASKSISNRLLIIAALQGGDIHVVNLSEANDTKLLQKALAAYSSSSELSVGPAGTAFRFMTTFLALKGYHGVLTGSQRMLERPIEVLVEVLRQMGASIEYVSAEGYPPLRFEPKTLNGGAFKIPASVSSQYISALLLIAPHIRNGIQLELTGGLVSEPYIEMTIALMKRFGAMVTKNGNTITVRENGYNKGEIEVESDWSAASYFFQIAALSKSCNLLLKGLHESSIQADSILPHWYCQFGVDCSWENNGLRISKTKPVLKDQFEFDCLGSPDLAQTLAFTCAGLGVGLKLTGLQTLAIKETNRLVAMQNELKKFGIESEIKTGDSFYMAKQKINKPNEMLSTYHDHRMAMAMAPLAIKVGELKIENPEVVNKSFPGFWGEINKTGLEST